MNKPVHKKFCQRCAISGNAIKYEIDKGRIQVIRYGGRLYICRRGKGRLRRMRAATEICRLPSCTCQPTKISRSSRKPRLLRSIARFVGLSR